MAYQTENAVSEDYFEADALPQQTETKKRPIITALYIAGGFFFSQLNCLGDISPFSSAFLCSIPFEYTLGVFASSAFGYFLALPWRDALKYTGVLAFCSLIRLIIHKKSPVLKPGTAYCLIPFCSLLAVNIATLFFISFDFYTVLIALCEALSSAVSSAFLIKSFRIPFGKISITDLSAKDKLCLMGCFCVTLMSASGFEVQGISPARILVSVFVMFISFYKGPSVACAIGVCAGISLCINPSCRYLFACYALGGLVSGIFSAYGQVLCSVLFALCYSACCVVSPGDSTVISLVECAVAAACFMLIPSGKLGEIQDYIEKKGLTNNGRINTQLSENLTLAAENIYEVSKIVGSVCERLDTVIGPEVNKLFASLQQSVCTGCESKNRCWNKMFTSTAKDIMAIAGIVPRERSCLSIEKRCVRIDSLKQQISALYSDYVNSMAVKMKIRDMRKVLTDQFSGIGDFLLEIAEKISLSRVVDTSRSVSLRGALNDSGIYVDALSYFTSPDGKITVEAVFVDRVFDADEKKMKTIIEFMTKRRFEKPEIKVSDIRTTVIFTEKAYFRVETGYYQRPMLKGNLCGDSVSIVSGIDGTQNAIISDGMGTGSRAAIDSTMTCTIMEKLVSSGFSFTGALKIVNSAMIMKSTDESIATIDAVSVNVYNGKTYFYKAGAAVSFIRHDKDVFTVQLQSLPIGIIRNISFAKQSAQLEQGDIVLLVSDGITAGDCSWINDELLAWSTNNMQDLAKHIVNLAHLRSDESLRDDLTAVAVKVVKNR